MNNAEILNKQDTDFMRATAIISIVLHHLSLQYEGIVILKPFKYVGFLMVGVFFFLSGFGLYVSMKTKENYLKKIPKKIMGLIIPFLVAWVFYFIFYKITGTEIKNLFLVVKYSWYIYELILFYILFYVCFKHFNENIACIILLISILVILFFTYYIGLVETWYKSSMPFIIGIVIAKNIEKFRTVLKNRLIFIWEAIVLIILLVIGQKMQLGWADIILYNLATVLFVLVFTKMYYYLKLNKISKARILQTIGNISLEIYLYHGLILEIIHKYSKTTYINIIGTLIVSLLFGYLMWKVKRFIENIIKKKPLNIMVGNIKNK